MEITKKKSLKKKKPRKRKEKIKEIFDFPRLPLERAFLISTKKIKEVKMKENGKEEECNEDIDAKKRMKGRKGKDE